jgi:hypothetical protein
MRPFGRRSYARPGANLAQGNLNSMPQILVSTKSQRFWVAGEHCKRWLVANSH